MFVVDAQIHLWSGAKPFNALMHRQLDAFTVDEALNGMDEAGVDAAIVHPPSWDPRSTEKAVEAVKQHPGRFAILGSFRLDNPENRNLLSTWKGQPGMVGLRFAFNTPEGPKPWFTDGTADWVWPAAEEAGLPVAVLAGRALWKAAEIAEQHPGLRLIIDHFGAEGSTLNERVWEQLDELLALARFPNIAIKATGAPCHSREDYPFRDIHDHLRRVYDSFGPARMFWGTDITRMSRSWRECVTLFTEELPWLTGRDKELVMGQAICDWLDWHPV